MKNDALALHLQSICNALASKTMKIAIYEREM